MNTPENRVLHYIRRAVYESRPTPTRDQIAKYAGARGCEVTSIVKALEESGQILARRTNGGCTRQFGAIVKGEVRWTVPRSTKRGRQGGKANDYGGGEIARMHNRLEAERLIAELYQGRTY